MKGNLDKYSADADLAKQKYINAQKAYDAEIIDCQNEISAFMKSGNTQELKTEYWHIFNKLHSLDIVNDNY